MDNLPRLDILLYAHDGRGLGHVSRTVAIGLALRRLFPSIKLLLITGSSATQELIGDAQLDWLKLPAYETEVVDGKSTGVKGKSNFNDKELGDLRGRQIEQIVSLYRPRVILCDHSPQGKHKELRPALEKHGNDSITWVLGLRGVIGQVSQVHSSLASTLFNRYFSALLWYGDSTCLGGETPEALGLHFDTTVVECGYVSRLREMMNHTAVDETNGLAGTISIPWLGEMTAEFLHQLNSALKQLGPKYGRWNIFMEQGDPQSQSVISALRELPFCTVRKISREYIASLMKSRCAVIYGGYNSLMDILALSLPALVVLRKMKDNEQQEHVEALIECTSTPLFCLSEESDSEKIYHTLQKIVSTDLNRQSGPALEGAAVAATHLHSLLQESSDDQILK